MPYDEKKGWIIPEKADIDDFFMRVFNAVKKTNYTSETFAGSQTWQAIQPSVLKCLEIEQNIGILLPTIFDEVSSIINDIVINSVGLEVGIRQALSAIEGVKNLGLKQDLAEVERGLIFLAIEYSPPFLINPPPEDTASINKNTEIANTLAKYVGAGILTKTLPETFPFEGLLANGQIFIYNWRLLLPLPVFFKVFFKIDKGSYKPDTDVLKTDFIAIFEEEYVIGGLFVPTELARNPKFDYFRFCEIAYSFDNAIFYSNEIQTNYFEKWTVLPENVLFISSEGLPLDEKK